MRKTITITYITSHTSNNLYYLKPVSSIHHKACASAMHHNTFRLPAITVNYEIYYHTYIHIHKLHIHEITIHLITPLTNTVAPSINNTAFHINPGLVSAYAPNRKEGNMHKNKLHIKCLQQKKSTQICKHANNPENKPPRTPKQVTCHPQVKYLKQTYPRAIHNTPPTYICNKLSHQSRHQSSTTASQHHSHK
eukprot:gene2861-1846_t